jgi:hypothetical protein
MVVSVATGSHPRNVIAKKGKDNTPFPFFGWRKPGQGQITFTWFFPPLSFRAPSRLLPERPDHPLSFHHPQEPPVLELALELPAEAEAVELALPSYRILRTLELKRRGLFPTIK